MCADFLQSDGVHEIDGLAEISHVPANAIRCPCEYAAIFATSDLCNDFIENRPLISLFRLVALSLHRHDLETFTFCKLEHLLDLGVD